jgi:hypothetical protein
VPGPKDALEAREQIKMAIRFLRDGRDDEFHLIEGTLSFESGALHALEWMLGLSGGVYFARHLEALKMIEPEILARLADDERTGSG